VINDSLSAYDSLLATRLTHILRFSSWGMVRSHLVIQSRKAARSSHEIPSLYAAHSPYPSPFDKRGSLPVADSFTWHGSLERDVSSHSGRISRFLRFLSLGADRSHIPFLSRKAAHSQIAFLIRQYGSLNDQRFSSCASVRSMSSFQVLEVGYPSGTGM
jgi:hypothetical protein